MASSHKCQECAEPFEITDHDIAFYVRMDVSAPQRCPACRQQRRFLWRNEHVLYRGTCASTGASILTMYPPESGLTIYEQKAWWGDSWNGLDYGRDFDFSRPFFEQFAELKKQVPHMNLCNDSMSIGCDYVNQTSYIKNSYLVFDCDYCENTYFSNTTKYCLYCMDCFRAFNCELCYECVDCKKCYNCQNSQDCEDCSDSYFLKNCKGCRNCFGCVNLRHKEYCYFNEQLTKAEYEKRVADWKMQTASGREAARQKIEEWFLQFPMKENHNIMTENSTGDYLANAKESRLCFDCSEIWDCSYCTNIFAGAKDCMDYDVWGNKAELVYNSITVGENAFNVMCSKNCWGDVSDLAYCDHCMHSAHLFGCVGLKKNQYCILNKQYSKEEYEKLRGRIVEHMKKGAEWGEFFPAENSSFGYNDTIAADYFPLSREAALEKGFRWTDSSQKSQQAPTISAPDDIENVQDGILEEVLACQSCHKNYRIIQQELALYRQLKIPIPRECLDCRHTRRLQKRNSRKLWERNCSNCDEKIQTSYGPDRAEKILCESCYLKNVY